MVLWSLKSSPIAMVPTGCGTGGVVCGGYSGSGGVSD